MKMGQINTKPKEILAGLDVMLESAAMPRFYRPLFDDAADYLVRNPLDHKFRAEIVEIAKKFHEPFSY